MRFSQFIRLVSALSLLMCYTVQESSAQDFCGTDQRHEQLMASDSEYAAFFEENNRRIASLILTKSLDLDNSEMITIPLVVHVMHTGEAIGTAYNPSTSDITDMIDGLNDFYANDNGLGLDINLQFVLAQRDESCSATTGINRVDASGVTDYTADGIILGVGGTGADEETLKALSKWNNVDYYNVWIVNKINGQDGTSGSFTAGFAYYPDSRIAVDGTVMLASQLDPTAITLAHEIGHALNLAHTFNGDNDGIDCPTDTDCTTDGDYCCDTPAHKRNAFSCITTGNTCTGDAVGDVYKNFMAYSGCQDRFTDDQRDRMRAALEVLRPGLVCSLGDELPPASVATAACTPGVNNPGSYGIGPRQFDFGDYRTYTAPQGSLGYSEYIDLACNQRYTVYPGQDIYVSVTTGAPYTQKARVFIDYNDNGTLDDSGELVLTSSGATAPETHSTTITIDASAETETPIRMRVWADYYSGGADGPCGNLVYGQAVDHSIYVEDVDVWEGTTSTDWNTASNWAKGSVPTASGNVRIPSSASNQPHVTLAAATPAVCNDLEVQSGATLTIDAGKALTASGDTDNEGTILIEADATGIGSLITSGTISGAGTFQMEQYLTGSGVATPSGLFYYVSSPMASATSNVYSAAGTDRLWSANEVTQSYGEITDNSTALSVAQGYVARMGATGTQTFEGGSFNTGSVSTSSLTRTGTAATNRGYNLVGNPYPSTVNWNDLTKTNLETTMWYRTHNGTNMVTDTYNATGSVGTNNNGGGIVTGVLPPTQAFWVRVDGDGNAGTVAFENADRSHGTATGIYRMAAEEGNIRIALSNGTLSDEQIVLFNPDASDNYDNYDSQKFWSNNVPQLYSNVNEDTLTINGLYSPFTTPIVPLGMKIPTQGNYTLNATTITFTETPVHLEDAYLGVFQNLNADPVYAFTSDAGNIGDRFVLHFSEVTGIDETENNISVYSVNDQIKVNLSTPSTGTITVLDMTGRAVHTQTINAQLSTIQLQITAGIYVVKVETAETRINQKVSIN